jgi:hypothetical protein
MFPFIEFLNVSKDFDGDVGQLVSELFNVIEK